eukprot:scaffold6299_cov107-Cylindrotheca_fusiformis.AAC.12
MHIGNLRIATMPFQVSQGRHEQSQAFFILSHVDVSAGRIVENDGSLVPVPAVGAVATEEKAKISHMIADKLIYRCAEVYPCSNMA